MTSEHHPKPNSLVDFLSKNVWAISLVTASVIAQWAVFGVRLDSIEDRQNRQDATIVVIQEQQKNAQSQYAALQQKVDSLNENVLYIRNRIDRVLNN